VFPSSLRIGRGAGMAFKPMMLAAMSDVRPVDSGVASGIVTTAFMMGGALGLAVLASVASTRTDSLRAGGESSAAALTGGYHAAFAVGALFALASAVVATVRLRVAAQPQPEPQPA